MVSLVGVVNLFGLALLFIIKIGYLKAFVVAHGRGLRVEEDAVDICHKKAILLWYQFIRLKVFIIVCLSPSTTCRCIAKKWHSSNFLLISLRIDFTHSFTYLLFLVNFAQEQRCLWLDVPQMIWNTIWFRFCRYCF